MLVQFVIGEEYIVPKSSQVNYYLSLEEYR